MNVNETNNNVTNKQTVTATKNTSSKVNIFASILKQAASN